MRIAARHADIWNGFGSPAVMANKIQVLQRHCDAVGRDPSTITATAALMLEPAQSSGRIAARLAEYQRVGVGAVIVDLPAPFDRSLLERLANEVRPSLP